MSFSKGHVPWNKNKKLSVEHIGKLRSAKLGKKQLPEHVKKRTQKLKGKHRSEETKIKISIGNKGKKHSKEQNFQVSQRMKNQKYVLGKHWKIKDTSKMKAHRSNHYIEDRTQLKKHPRKDHDSAYKYWMLEVKKRDDWKCRLLSSDCKGRLESHHIFNWRDYPELRYLLTNGITLCQFHHPRKWEEEKRLIPVFQELVSVSKE